jgi:hypothetical protein
MAPTQGEPTASGEGADRERGYGQGQVPGHGGVAADLAVGQLEVVSLLVLGTAPAQATFAAPVAPRFKVAR